MHYNKIRKKENYLTVTLIVPVFLSLSVTVIVVFPALTPLMLTLFSLTDTVAILTSFATAEYGCAPPFTVTIPSFQHSQ